MHLDAISAPAEHSKWKAGTVNVDIAVLVLGAFILFFVIYIVRRTRSLRRTINGIDSPAKGSNPDKGSTD